MLYWYYCLYLILNQSDRPIRAGAGTSPQLVLSPLFGLLHPSPPLLRSVLQYKSQAALFFPDTHSGRAHTPTARRTCPHTGANPLTTPQCPEQIKRAATSQTVIQMCHLLRGSGHTLSLLSALLPCPLPPRDSAPCFGFFFSPPSSAPPPADDSL